MLKLDKKTLDYVVVWRVPKHRMTPARPAHSALYHSHAHMRGLRFTGTEAGGTAECTAWSGEAGGQSATLSVLGSVLFVAYILAQRLTRHRMQSGDCPSMEIDS